MKLKKDSIGYVIVFTFVVCMVFVVVLAFADMATKAQVQANKNYEAHFAVLRAFGLADANTPKSTIEELYSANVKTLASPEPKTSAFSATINGQSFVAVQLTNPGLWGPITAILAMDPQATRMQGFEVLDQQETPGLGGRISERWFQDQFKGEAIPASGKIAVIPGSGKGDPNHDNGSVDAITGASRTSDFVATLVAKGIALAKRIGGTP